MPLAVNVSTLTAIAAVAVTELLDTEVIRPNESIVRLGIEEPVPYTPAVTPVFARPSAMFPVAELAVN